MIALQTLAAFNYGAGKFKRVKDAYFSALICSSVWGIVVTLILCFNSEFLLRLFTQNPDIINEGKSIAAICFLGFIASGFVMMSSGLFQGIGKAFPSIFLDSAKTYFLLIPMIFILPIFFHREGIWMSFPIADCIGGSLALAYSYRYLIRLTQHKS